MKMRQALLTVTLLSLSSIIYSQRLILPNLLVKDTALVKFNETDVIGSAPFERTVYFTYMNGEGTFTVAASSDQSTIQSELSTKLESGIKAETYNGWLLSETLQSTMLASDTVTIAFYYIPMNEFETPEAYEVRGKEIAEQLKKTGGFQDELNANIEFGNAALDVNINDTGEEFWPMFGDHEVGDVYSLLSGSDVYIIQTTAKKRKSPSATSVNSMQYEILTFHEGGGIRTALAYVTNEDGFSSAKNLVNAIQVLSPLEMDQAFGFPLSEKKMEERIDYYKAFIVEDEYETTSVETQFETWMEHGFSLTKYKSFNDQVNQNCSSLEDLLAVYLTHEAFTSSDLTMNDGALDYEEGEFFTVDVQPSDACTSAMDSLINLMIETGEYYYFSESEFSAAIPQFKTLLHNAMMERSLFPGYIYDHKLLYRKGNQLFFAFGLFDDSFSMRTEYALFEYQNGFFQFSPISLPIEFYEYANGSEELFQTEVEVSGMSNMLVLKSSETNHIYLSKMNQLRDNNWTLLQAAIPTKSNFAITVSDAEYLEYGKNISFYTTTIASPLTASMKKMLPDLMSQFERNYAVGDCYSMYEPVNLPDGSCVEKYTYEEAVRAMAQPKDWVYQSLPIYSDFNNDGMMDIACLCASNGKLLSVAGYYLGGETVVPIEMKSFIKFTQQNKSIQNFLICTQLYQD